MLCAHENNPLQREGWRRTEWADNRRNKVLEKMRRNGIQETRDRIFLSLKKLDVSSIVMMQTQEYL